MLPRSALKSRALKFPRQILKECLEWKYRLSGRLKVLCSAIVGHLLPGIFIWKPKQSHGCRICDLIARSRAPRDRLLVMPDTAENLNPSHKSNHSVGSLKAHSILLMQYRLDFYFLLWSHTSKSASSRHSGKSTLGLFHRHPWIILWPDAPFDILTSDFDSSVRDHHRARTSKRSPALHWT